MQYRNHDAISAKILTEKYSDTVYVVQNPPQPPLEREELDDLYDLPFENDIILLTRPPEGFRHFAR